MNLPSLAETELIRPGAFHCHPVTYHPLLPLRLRCPLEAERASRSAESRRGARRVRLRRIPRLLLFSLMTALLAVLCLAIPSFAADEVAMPPVTKPVMFDTPEADRILSALQVFPPDNPWNEDISNRPVLRNSSAIIAGIGPDKRLACNLDMAFILVPGDQKRVVAKILMYPEESDPGPYPIPDDAPIESWPLDGRSLSTAQRAQEAGDRHVIVVDHSLVGVTMLRAVYFECQQTVACA